MSVGINPRHGIGKSPCGSIQLIAGRGVEGDAHFGELVQHRWLKKNNSALPNRTQVHLLPEELFVELAERGVTVGFGQMGENVTTCGLDLLRLPVGTRLRLGKEAVVELTGLREPCSQLNKVWPGLMSLLRYRVAGRIIRRAGVMAVVLRSGRVQQGDEIRVEYPDLPHQAMGPV